MATKVKSNGVGLKLSRKDFQSDQTVRWCPGCGDYAILPARFDLSEEGRKRLGLDEFSRNAAGVLSKTGDEEVPPFELEQAMEEAPVT